LLRILIFGCLLVALAGVPGAFLQADTIQLPHGAELTVDFAMPGFDPNDPAALFPTTIGLDLAGSVPSGSATSTIPGSSQLYYSGFQLQVSLESTAGTVALPLFDADSWRLGLGTGTLVADATGGNTWMSSAEVAVSLNASEAIFSATGTAEFVIQNVGDAITIGLGPGYSLSNAILAPLTSDNGGVQSAGYLTGMSMTQDAISPSQISLVPEPAVLGLAAGGGLLLLLARRRLRR
jgi:hypothetical protein